MAEGFSRPSGAFSFKFRGLNSRSPADKLEGDKYALAQNIRAYDDTSIRNRPGLAKIAAGSANNAVTALRAYAAIETDNAPRYLFKSSTSVYLDNSTVVDTGYAAGLGASFIPYRPNQSPQSWMYIGDSNQYRKLSAPSASNAVTAQKVGIQEPLIPVDAGISNINFAYTGLPLPDGTNFVPTGTAGAISNGDRISDTVQGVFPDPTGLGIKTLQVSEPGSSLAPGVYKIGGITAYFWNHANDGVFQPNYPLDPSTAAATATGNSLNFNYSTFHEPSYQPMDWALIADGAVVGSFQPWSGATKDYDMVVLANLYVPVAGNFVISIGHDDGMIFAIAGATIVSGPYSNGASQTKTAVAGYTFASGSPLGGNNHEGAYGDTFVINFPHAGVYPIEIDYNQRTVYQELNVLAGGNLIIDAGTSPAYQRYMALELTNGSSGLAVTVQDVFPPLPSQIAIESIYYYSGSTGRCIVVPASLSPVGGTDGQSLYEASILSGLRRGALVQIGSEVCLVENVTNGPAGNVCFETTTVSAHTSTDTLIGVPAISVFDPTNFTITGTAINSPTYTFTVNKGIGAISAQTGLNPFVSNSFSFQPEDYIHLSINVDNLSNINEIKLSFDVGGSTFTENFYYHSIRPNDIQAGISNALTQLGVAQLVAQRAIIDEQSAAESGNQGFTNSSSQTTTGDSQWSEIIFPISALTRVGNDQSKSLQNTGAVQVLFNCSGPASIQINSITTMGGFAPDVGDIGAPYQYVIRARSSITGARSNPSPPMRYGITTRRGQVTVLVPTSFSDSQADQWDVFRFGGALSNYTYVGSVPIGSSNKFIDTYSDNSVISSDQIEYDNFEPWPTVDLPLNATASVITGTIAVVDVIDPSLSFKVSRYLPGNLVQVGQQVYRLWTRPTQLSDTVFLFQFVENAGSVVSGSAVNIYEPAMANQILPYLWGPTEEGGNIFACGDPIRPGFVYFCKNFQPDSAPDRYNLELCPPSEPLLGGETLNGNSYVASTIRWWQMRPSFGGENQYAPVEAPFGRGLAAPYGHCSDGSRIYFVAKDGIYASGGGTAVSLTDEDLYNLFPHEGVSGRNYTYNGITVFAPDYGRAENFRLAYCQNYLFFDYQDSTGVSRTLVYDIRNTGWIVDEYLNGSGISAHYGIEQQEGSLDNSDVTYGLLVMGGKDGSLYKQVDQARDDSQPFTCYLATREFTAGDLRAPKLIGDVFLDYFFSNASSPSTVNLGVQYMNLGTSVFSQALGAAAGRQQDTLNVAGGGQFFQSFGMFFRWVVPFGMPPVTLYTWQPSYIVKPESTSGRAEDWDDAGLTGAKWMQGFIVESICPNPKQIAVRDADTNTLKQTFTLTSAVQDQQAFSFTQPFVSHMVRLEPQDTVDWNFFKVTWIYEPSPEEVSHWETQGSALGFPDYGHVYNLEIAYSARSAVNFTMTFDGNVQTYVIPSTGGQYRKYNLNLMANKGKVYTFAFQSSSGQRDIRLWLPDMVFQVGAWDRSTPYANHQEMGGPAGPGAKV